MSTKESHNVASNFRVCFIANIYECPGSKAANNQASVSPHDDPDSNLEKHRNRNTAATFRMGTEVLLILSTKTVGKLVWAFQSNY